MLLKERIKDDNYYSIEDLIKEYLDKECEIIDNITIKVKDVKDSVYLKLIKGSWYVGIIKNK